MPNNTNDVERIVNNIIELCQASIFNNFMPFEYCIGEVTSVSPLLIKVSDRIELDASHFILSGFVQETWINVPWHESPGHFHHNVQPSDSHGDSEQEFDDQLALPKILLWRGLREGDVVRMLKVQNGQYYYVLERESGITNEKE